MSTGVLGLWPSLHSRLALTKVDRTDWLMLDSDVSHVFLGPKRVFCKQEASYHCAVKFQTSYSWWCQLPGVANFDIIAAVDGEVELIQIVKSAILVFAAALLVFHHHGLLKWELH